MGLDGFLLPTQRFRVGALTKFEGRRITYAGMIDGHTFSVVHHRQEGGAINLYFPTSAQEIDIEDRPYWVKEVTPEYLSLKLKAR